ncbi:hypothetical protein [Tessaracoccus sp. MC1756]|uniref:hypothetical protein n=1 Tax=Tessaracoccus sp. MC1756 TaxID=2760311 RepID=UPI0016041AD0|nr:hypothetical protein [Tessaracoccus sp. MC1756]MBB1510179.1 hypothetical protein [Tessaracoccus sp. MC1756]
MSVSRRSALALLTLGMTGCTTSPVILGGPDTRTAPPPEPSPEPTRSPEATLAHQSVADLRALVAARVDSPHWEAQPWAVAALAQCDAHVARLAVPDPLSDIDQEPFEVTAAPVTAPSDPGVATNRLEAAVSRAGDALEDMAARAGDGDLRLCYASMATAVLGLRNQAVAPVEGEAAARRLQTTTVEASLPILLGHVWALIYGLGVGLGRISQDNALHATGLVRLNRARELRNTLRDRLGTEAPEQPAAFDLPTTMDSLETIRAGWGLLETQVLNGFARLVAADPDPQWRDGMRGQVAPVQETGTALTWWPGWLA